MSVHDRMRAAVVQWITTHEGTVALDDDTIVFPTGHEVDLAEFRDTLSDGMGVEEATTSYLDTLWDHAQGTNDRTHRRETLTHLIADLLTEEGFIVETLPGEVRYETGTTWEAIDIDGLLSLLGGLPDEHLHAAARRVVEVAAGGVDLKIPEQGHAEPTTTEDVPTTWEETLPLLRSVLLPSSQEDILDSALAQVTPHVYECLTLTVDGEAVLIPRDVIHEMPLPIEDLLAHGRSNSHQAAGDALHTREVKGSPLLVVDCTGPHVSGFLPLLAQLPGAGEDGVVLILPTNRDLAAVPVAKTLTPEVLNELREASRILHTNGEGPLDPEILWMHKGTFHEVKLDTTGNIVGPEELTQILAGL